MYMKKIFTLTALLIQSIIMLAAAPTNPSRDFIFSNVDGTSLNIQFTAGNGNFRIVVLKAGSAVTGTPVNGSSYNYNQSFATPAAAFTGANEYVVYRGSGNSFPVTNLQPNTVYHIAVFEFNGAAGATEYLMTPLAGSRSTAVTPATQANISSITNVTGNSARLNLAFGNGGSRLILARKGAAVNAEPADLTNYIASTNFGDGAVLNGSNYVLYKLSGATFTVDSLEPNSIYHFSIFEKNGDNAPVFLRPGNTATVTTNAGPTQNTGNFSFSSQEGNRFAVSAARGNGAKRLYIIKKGSPVTASPTNGQRYQHNTAYGSGYMIGPDEYVVNASNLTLVTVTNLEPATTYYFRSFEYDEDAAGNTYYLLTNPSNGSYSTASAPSAPSNVRFENITGNSLSVKYDAGGGSYRMVMMREGGPVDAVPVNLIRYTGNGAFKSGDRLGADNYVLNGGSNGFTTNVTNLQPGHTYHVTVYEMSGNNYPVYSTLSSSAFITMPNQPTAASTGFSKSSIEGNSVHIGWTSGDGTRRIVVARKGAPVTALPVDGATYTPNPNFGQGPFIEAGQFVVYDNIGAGFDLKNLEIGSTYHIAVFEYNLSGTGPDYLVSAFLTGNATTLSAPISGPGNVSANNIQSTQATINYLSGGGTGRLFLMREGSAVNTEPVDLTAYGYNNVFGNLEIGSGNHIVHRASTSGSFNVTGLNPNTVYHVAVFEFNGSTGPVYRRPAYTINFTTAPSQVITAPTSAATLPVFSSIEGNKMKLGWNNGNGTNRIVVARMGQAVNFVPADGTVYTGNPDFNSGTDLGNGQFVVFNSTTNTAPATINNLLPGTTYHFAVFEYNGSGASIKYLTAPLAASQPTLSAPLSGSQDVSGTFTATTITLNWASGSGDSRLVIMKEGSAVSGNPVNLSVYPADPIFTRGSLTGTGEYVVYSGTGNTATITGLTANKTYHFKIVEFNGNTGPVYNTTQVLSGNVTTATTLPVTWLYFRGQAQQQSVKLEWGTSAEQNSAYFVIERSNGQGYASIDTVVAVGNSNTDRHYNYIDASAPAGNLQYRLKQVDIDGRSAYSQVISIRSNVVEVKFSVFPNPASASIKISLNDAATAHLSIVDVRGALVQQQKVNNNSTIYISRLTPGIYYVTVENNGKKFTEKLVKQ